MAQKIVGGEKKRGWLCHLQFQASRVLCARGDVMKTSFSERVACRSDRPGPLI